MGLPVGQRVAQALGLGHEPNSDTQIAPPGFPHTESPKEI